MFVLSMTFNNQSQRFCKMLKSEESATLAQKMKEYFFTLNLYNLKDVRKIIDFSSIPFDQFVTNFLKLSSNEEKLYFFKKFNKMTNFSLLHQKKLLSFFQNSHRNSLVSSNKNIHSKKKFHPEYVYNPFSSDCVYYLKGKHLSVKKIYRIQQHESQLILSCYEPFTQKTDYCLITSPNEITKLLNLLKLRSQGFKWKVMLANVSFHKTLIGKKLYFNRKDPESFAFCEGRVSDFKTADLLTGVQHPFLRNHYRNEIIYELYDVRCIGKCYIKIRVFFPLSEDTPKDFIKLKCEFFPVKEKRKMLKLAFSYGDFRSFFKNELHFSNIRALLNQLNHSVFSKIILHKENVQYNIALKSEEHNSLFKVIRMDFSARNSVRESHSILQIEALKYRTVCQFMKKIKGHFSVITIKQHLYLNSWNVNIYFPHSNRTFTVTLYPYELAGLSRNFWRLFIIPKINSIANLVSEGNSEKKSLDFNSMPKIDDMLCHFQKNYKDIRSSLAEACKGVKIGSLMGYLAKRTGFLFNWNKEVYIF